ncbi:MAG: HAMP domain-containing histidine kinase [Oscillospiraceae bacterium]|jgi:signal transduction histidine kinase|nr:HAMP domain-containing histidine kinase [Oscillospiraceae bacterium]
MKKLLTKSWAKIFAFVLLTVMALTITVSGFGLYSLIDSGIFTSNNEYEAQHKTIISVSVSYFWQQMALVENYCSVYFENRDKENSTALADFEEHFSEKNSNFFFVVTDQSGKELLRNYSNDDYQYSQASTRNMLLNERIETKDLSFRTDKERQEYIRMCERNYADVSHQNWEGDIDDDGKLDYVLKIRYTVWDKQTIHITGYVRSQLIVQDGFFEAANWVSNLFSLRYWLIVCCSISFLCGVFLLAFLSCGAGRKAGKEGIHLSLPDKIPFDLYVALPLLAAGYFIRLFIYNAYGGYEIADYIIYGIAPAIIWLPLVLSLPITFAARLKAGNWWINTILHKICRGVAYILRSLPLFWKEWLVCLSIAFIELAAFSFFKDNEKILIYLWLFEKLLLAVMVALAAIDIRRLLKGIGEIAGGNFKFVIDLKNMFPGLKKHGKNLNNINARMNLTVDELTKSERMKAELITNVSHDIKTPVTSIVNYVDILKNENGLPDKFKEYVSVLDRQSKRLKKLIEDLVEAAKASAGNMPVNLEPMDINLLLSQAVGEYEDRLSKQKLEMILTLSPNAPVILADGRMLWRVLDNLLSNLCKYALEGTRVYLSTEVSEEKVGVMLKNISNHQLNISGDELIERFVRGDSSRSGEGSGLGLSIARGLTELQKGSFEMAIDGDLFKTVLTFERCK